MLYTRNYYIKMNYNAFSDGSMVKNLPTNAGAIGDVGLIPGSGKFLGIGNSNPLHYSCLENSMDARTWQAMGSQRVRHDWATSILYYNLKFGGVMPLALGSMDILTIYIC